MRSRFRRDWAWDVSDVHIERCLFENTTGNGWHEGLNAGSSHVTMQSTIIRNMQIAVDVYDRGDVNLQSFNTYYPLSQPTDVVVDNPAGTNFQGIKVGSGAALSVGDTRLRINNAGQPWGSNTAGVWVTDGSTLTDDNGNLIITGSQGQGIFVSNNSHATLGSSRITGGSHGGLVAANLSTISVGRGNSTTLVSSNVADLSCDSKSIITGVARLAGAAVVNCGNFLPDDTEPLP